jgi:hypothetical protein
MKKFIVLFFIIPVFLFGSRAEAASLYLSPKSGIYNIEGTFSIKVMVDTEGKIINAADATLKFNPQELTVIDISKTNSIFNFWTTEPNFNNSDGLIDFAGGKTSSFTGEDGNIISITFKALSNVTAEVTFKAGAVLASDGKATNILDTVQNGTYDLEPEFIVPPSKRGQEPLVIAEGTPLVPVVFSSTHSNEDAWYSNSSPVFSWEMPSGITAVRLLMDKDSFSLPTQEYPASLTEKKFDNLEDGIWYFHIRFKNEYGWGEISHRKVLIDTNSPESFQIETDNGGDNTNPSPVLHFEAEDNLSGIGYYEIKISELGVVRVEEPFYKIPPQEPGIHTIIVKAFDNAKNLSTAITEFSLESIASPEIIDYPTTDKVGEALTIKGVSLYPDARLLVSVKKENIQAEEREVKTDSNGNWNFIYDKSLQEGIYQVWAQVIDGREAKSNPSEKITIIITQPFLIKIGQLAISYLTVILSLAGLLVISVFFIIYVRNRILQWRKRLKKETKEIAQSLVKAFTLLEEKIQKQIEYLDKKPGLSKDEQKLYDELKGALNSSKDIIGKEIRDVEEELK